MHHAGAMRVVGLGYPFKCPMALKHSVQVGYILIFSIHLSLLRTRQLSQRHLQTDAVVCVQFALRVRACSCVGTTGNPAGVPKPCVGKTVGPPSLSAAWASANNEQSLCSTARFELCRVNVVVNTGILDRYALGRKVDSHTRTNHCCSCHSVSAYRNGVPSA